MWCASVRHSRTFAASDQSTLAVAAPPTWWAGSGCSPRSGPMTAVRRKRGLQSLVAAPKPSFGKDAANDDCEPFVPNFCDTTYVSQSWREKVFDNLLAFERGLWQV